MTTKTILLGTLLAVAGTANAQSVTFQRTYAIGDKDAYAVSVQTTGARTMTMSMTETLVVTKLLDEGGAELSVTLSNMQMDQNGKVMTLPASLASGMTMVEDFNKQGFPYNVKGPGAQMGGGMPIYGPKLFANGFGVGQSEPLDYDSPNGHSTGTATLTDVTNGIANLHIVMDTVHKNGTTAHMDAVYSVNVSNGKGTKYVIKVTESGGKGSETLITMTLQ